MAFTAGDLIDGHFRVERRFEGGMGFVYLVRDEVVGKRFAIKQLPEFHAENKVLLERFRREATAWLLLEHHPNIVQAHSYHPRPEGPMLILECVDGPSLDQLLKLEKKLCQVQVVRYARQFCQAMHFAHTKPIPDRGVGVLHRDIKPGNILITRGNQLKVGDFGLAKFEDGGKLTGEGQYVGTLAYSSPEQLRASSEVTKESDVYSFGAVMYQMLLGHPPFRAANAAELYRLIQQTTPLSLGELCPDLDRALVGVVMRCLEKEPSARFSDFSQLERALDGMELTLCDQRDWTCSQCGYTSRGQATSCPVCEAPVNAKPQAARPLAKAPGWSCACGARVSHAENVCPKCGRTRVNRAAVPTDDDAQLPVPEDLVLLPFANGVEPAPPEQQPGDSSWPANVEAAVSPADSHVRTATARSKPQTATLRRLWNPAGSQPCLVEIGAREKLMAWPLVRTSYTIGRDAQMKIRLTDPSAAGYQLLLVQLSCGWLAINRLLGSRLEINGWKMDQRLLHPADLIRFGSTWLAFAGPQPSSEPMPPIPGHWPDRVGPSTQTVKSGGSSPTRVQVQQSTVCVLEQPGGAAVSTYGDPLRIGNSVLCDVRLNDKTVAPVQALVAWQTDGPHIINLTGSQVSLTDGQPVLDHLIVPGDVLRIGKATIPVRLEGDPTAPARLRASDDAAAPRRLALTIVAGPQKGQTALLPYGPPIILGRHSECDLSIASDSAMSRRHLQLTARAGMIEAKDLGSRHGFAVGSDVSTTTAPARLGDVLRVGRSYFLVHFELG